MEKHLLLAVNNDVRSMFEADFIGSFFKKKDEIRVTLFSVAPKSYHQHDDQIVSSDLKIPGANLSADNWQEGIHLNREHLINLGFRDDHITNKVIRSRYGTIEDIILEGKKGSYDAVILARHAIGGLLDQTFSTSVSREILNHQIDFPVWVCKHPETGRRNVLLCVDEDGASMRVAGHVGFILQQEIEHNITIFHVDSGERSKTRYVLDCARQILVDHGISDTRIRSLAVQSHRVIDSIRVEVETGRYSVIALGHDRALPTGLKELLIGSRCMKILEMIDRCVLWVSQ